MSAHTPGPWEWRGGRWKELVSLSSPKVWPNGFESPRVVIDDGSAGDEYSPSIDVDGPDARLIAASPDLLEALQELIGVAGLLAPTCLGDEGLKENCLDRARAAIAKATGGEA